MSGRTLTTRQYRWLDRATKLTGILLIAAGIDVGGATAAGLLLAGVGVAIGLTTVFLNMEQR